MLKWIRTREWNDWFHALCWAGLIVTFVLTTWWMALLLWVYEWAVWFGWVAYMERRHPKELQAFFERLAVKDSAESKPKE